VVTGRVVVDGAGGAVATGKVVVGAITAAVVGGVESPVASSDSPPEMTKPMIAPRSTVTMTARMMIQVVFESLASRPSSVIG
jgi:hypothetical protein